jgi:hypothetical protein
LKIVLWCFFAAVPPTSAQRWQNNGPTTVPANFKGITTDQTYTPLPIVGSDGVATTQPAIRVGPITDQLRREYHLNPFYTKTLTIDGIPIIGSDKVSDFAFLECAYTLDHMLMNTNEQEYWAEGAQAWFDCASQRKDATVHSGIWNRDQLKAYDPRLAKLLQDTYGDGPWRYVKTTGRPLHVGDTILTRTPQEMAHLTGLDRSLIPAFNFNNSPRILAAARATSRPQ